MHLSLKKIRLKEGGEVMICRSASWDGSDGGRKVIKVHVMKAVTQHFH
jgi:hypothetical protein